MHAWPQRWTLVMLRVVESHVANYFLLLIRSRIRFSNAGTGDLRLKSSSCVCTWSHAGPAPYLSESETCSDFPPTRCSKEIHERTSSAIVDPTQVACASFRSCLVRAKRWWCTRFAPGSFEPSGSGAYVLLLPGSSLAVVVPTFGGHVVEAFGVCHATKS
jgi:hypothetical protein